MGCNLSKYRSLQPTIIEEVKTMAMTCPIEGCQSKGMCRHKVMIMGLMAVIIAAIIYYLAR